MPQTFRAFHRGASKERPVEIERVDAELVVRDAGSGEETARLIFEGVWLTEFPNGLFVQGKGASYRVHPEDLASAVAVFENVKDIGAGEIFGEPPAAGTPRWQYAVLNLGMFNTVERMQMTLARAGLNGWELVATMDKASNWFQGMEKGFLLLKRPVPDGHTPRDWCIVVRR